MGKFICSKKCLQIQLFHRCFQKILPKHSRTFTERSTPFSDTCLKLTAIFLKIVIIFLGRNTPNNKFLDVANKETKKVTWHGCWSPSSMSLEQLIFTWKGWHSVLTLFASNPKTRYLVRFEVFLSLFYFWHSKRSHMIEPYVVHCFLSFFLNAATKI